MLLLSPPLRRRLPGNLRPTLRGQNRSPRRAALQPAAPRELLRRSKLSVSIYYLPRGYVADELRQGDGITGPGDALGCHGLEVPEHDIGQSDHHEHQTQDRQDALPP